MEPIKPNRSAPANLSACTVKDIIEPAKTISNKVSVKAALDEMRARAIDSSLVAGERGELLGSLSKNKMNRNVGGFGHDPDIEPVEAQMEKNISFCFEDQTIAEAEQIVVDAKVVEIPVLKRTGDRLLVGTINTEAIARGKRRGV
jgi:CBS domain-containing protein